MKIGSLCTGYGGIELGLALAGENVDLRWFAETGPAARLYDGTDVPNLGDIKAVDWTTVEPVDLLTAGFPCQPVSAAGRQRGIADDRWLWPAVYDGIRDLRPERVLLENVRNLIAIHKGEPWQGILDDLWGLGYEVTWLTMGACRVGAAHHRHRAFVLATRTDTPHAQAATRLDVAECGAKAPPLILLPTPRVAATRTSFRAATAAHSRSAPSLDQALEIAAGLLPHEFSEWEQLPRSWQPFPTPAARHGQGRGTPNEGTATERWKSGRRNIDDALALLPTPNAALGRSTGFPSPRTAADRYAKGNRFLDDAVALLTPRASDGVNGGPGQRGSSGDLAMPSAVQPQHWGRFADAVARHEATYGPAPAPTEPNRNGAPRLAAAFAEWLMCLPAGHVTGVLDRRDALAAIGNGVCPPQAAAAWLLLTGREDVLDMSLGQSVASSAMTTSIPLAAQAADIQQRHDAQRQRVIGAGLRILDPSQGQVERGHALSAELIEAALMELAAVWREEAAWWESSGRRGAKGTAKEFTQAAARVAGFAIGLKATATPQLAAEDVHPPQCDCGRPTCAALSLAEPVAQATVPIVDGKMVGTPCPHPDDAWSTLKSGRTRCTLCGHEFDPTTPLDAALPLIEQPHHLGDVPMQPTASPVSPSPFASPVVAAETLQDGTPPVVAGNPFISPAPPTRKVSVERLSYAELGPLIAATYPTGTRTHFSHSFVEDAETCGLKALLGDASRHGHVGPRRPSWALIGGTAFHNVVEGIERIALELGGQDPRAEFPDLPKVWESALDLAISDAATAAEGSPYVKNETWHVSNKGLEGYDWWRVKGLDMVKAYLDKHDSAFRASHTLLRLPVIVDGAATHTAPALEFELTGAVGTIPVTHRLDAAWVAHPLPNTVNQYDTATVEIVDFKSGARDPQSSFQMVEYADILRRHYLPANFALPIVGRFYLARKGIYSDPVPLPAPEYPNAAPAEIGYRYEMARRKVAAGVFEPSPSNFCSGCGHVDRCPAQRSRDSS